MIRSIWSSILSDGAIDIKYVVCEIEGEHARKKCLFFSCLQHFSALGDFIHSIPLFKNKKYLLGKDATDT